MYVCIHIHTYIYICVYIHIHICMYVYINFLRNKGKKKSRKTLFMPIFSGLRHF